MIGPDDEYEKEEEEEEDNKGPKVWWPEYDFESYEAYLAWCDHMNHLIDERRGK